MCHPAAFVVMSVMQAQQAQQAQDAQVSAANAAAQQNAEMQGEAYQHDMASAYAEEINIEKEGYKSAEDAASAKLDMLVMAREDQARLQSQNFETIGGGQTADAIMLVCFTLHFRILLGCRIRSTNLCVLCLLSLLCLHYRHYYKGCWMTHSYLPIINKLNGIPSSPNSGSCFTNENPSFSSHLLVCLFLLST
jgi:hypothetical protein